ncbi:hypothetical protein [Dysgonomonas sp. ZJ279]|uniref:hypothetical protein n=1 Tax=Dysgonomonas sp. ZJ279 TaxID=2709796 RepID=UPI0013ECD532|nr:hypothetical protein [Dysgonomonas sp. ZJ279]
MKYLFSLILTFISLYAYAITSKADQKSNNDFFQKMEINSDISIDSLFSILTKTIGVDYLDEQAKVLHCDTVSTEDGSCQIIRKIGGVKQTTVYNNVRRKGTNLLNLNSSNCLGIININNGYSTENSYYTCVCVIDEPQKNKIKYNEKQFSYYVIEPDPVNCFTPYACTISTYLIFAGNDVIPYELELVYNICNFRTGDIDKDGNLDFLKISPLLSEDELKLEKKDRIDYHNCDDDRGVYYKITAITYKNNKWQNLLNEGKEIYIIIKLEEAFNASSQFKVLNYHWYKR